MYIVSLLSSFSAPSKIQSRVPLQGAIIAPLLFNIFIADQTTSINTFITEYADAKAIISTHENHFTASSRLQAHVTTIES
ncbi:Uncharacterized protein FWK35_00019286 [Aphis craccivora]|uniref:Reverse transcriptase domain-containing protein n=1 Tax=Aphis craccivora TaxID=307492 RepID=A0A6G0YGC7_APHCR|nr:Uncharacterized protein FWK35_00019286 [Aphis craccivora]